MSLGNAYSNLIDWKKSEKYYEKAAEAAKKLELAERYAAAKCNLSHIYAMNDKYDRALELNLEAVNRMEGLARHPNYPIYLSNLGMAYIKAGKLPEALEALMKSKKLFSPQNQPSAYSCLLLNLAQYHFLCCEYDPALKYLEEAEALALKIDSVSALSAIYELCYMIAFSKGDKDLAFNYHNLFINTLRELWGREKEAGIKAIETKYEVIRDKHLAQIYKLKNIQLKKKNQQVMDQKAQLEEALEDLKKANHTKDRLFSIISHDMRGPLGSLYQGLELLSEPYFSPEERQDFINDLTETAVQVYRMTDNLLYWASHQMRVISNHPAEVDLSQIVQVIVNNHKSIARIKQIEIIQNLLTPHPAFVDGNILSIVLRNLLSNALKFTPVNGKITISIAPRKNLYRCQVSDTGAGIEQETLDRLFGPERDFITHGTNLEKGVGLGLLLCKDFTALMGSTIYVKSELGKGTTFWFDIPMILG